MIKRLTAILLLIMATPALAQVNVTQEGNWADSQVSNVLTLGTGSTVNGTVIGGVTPAAGSFTTGSFAGNLTFATDNTYSIGTLAANRPLNVNVGQSVNAGLSVNVNTAGAGLMQPGANGDMGSWASAYNIRSNTQPIVFFTGSTLGAQTSTGTERLRIATSGVVTIAGQMAANDVALSKTITAGGTTGAQTINKACGSVNFAAAATSLVVTNSLVTTSSVIVATVATNDSTAIVKNVVAGSGSFTITLNAAATAETRVNFIVIN